ncbi:restriction endonuclease subunit S [Endozoicomonas sp. ONNA1]|uniref:restriction endonuclease subunit S n=1 Tax=Endozoicomonas sp. ONNA1 TaxID=2828740 RepID=UPI002147ED10|nr:restriction endonuclease subunit S [Endozoicomonas sp. ONNA1]
MKWVQKRLGDITTIISGTTPKSAISEYWSGDFVWITPTDLGKLKSKLICSSERTITQKGLDSCNLSKITKGSVVMSSRAPIGHLAISECDFYTNQGCKSFVCGPEINNNFLYFLLKYRMSDIQALGSGATFAEVSKTALENFIVDIPDKVVDQIKIASKLEGQMVEVGSAREAAEVQLKDLSLLRKRQNQKVEQNLKGVKRISLESLLITIEAGKSLKTSEQLANSNEYGILKVSAVSWSEFQPTEAKRFENDSYQPPEHHKVRKGDLIISRANTLELVGAAVYVDEDYPFRLLSDKTLRLVLREDKILPEFLLCILRLSEARDHIESNATGSSDSMRNISQKTIRSIPVPLPDKDVQLKIIQLVKASRKLIGTAEQSAKQIIADTKLMPTKLLTQTFNH